MNVYALVGGVLLAVALFGAGYWTGGHVAEGVCAEAQAAQRADYERQLREKDDAARRAAEKAAGEKVALEGRLRDATKEVIRYVQTPAARAVCLDADGVRVWNRDAEAGAAPVRPQ